MGTGLIHIYCGNGKGKTTAATGLAVRAAGAGMKVLIARFLKNNDSAELNSLNLIPGIEVIPIEKEFGFIRNKENPVRISAKEYYSEYFEKAVRRAVKEDVDLFIMDEINAAISLEIVELDKLTGFLRNKPEKMEVVLTGRNPASCICELADYISEINPVKHPFTKGIAARKGIEY